MPEHKHILVVDDEKVIASTLAVILTYYHLVGLILVIGAQAQWEWELAAIKQEAVTKRSPAAQATLGPKTLQYFFCR